MRKKSISIGIMVLLLIIGVEILLSSKEIMETVSFSFRVWKDNIFPSLFPFFILSTLLIEFGFVELVSELLKPLMTRVFKIGSHTAFIFVMSMISGFPSNAKYTKELYDKGLVTKEEATKILTFTHFSNPLFILGTVSILFLNNKEVGFLILLSHYITNFIIGVLFRNFLPSKEEKATCSIKKAFSAMHEKRIHNPKKLGTIITEAVMGAIKTLLLVLGTVTMFLVLSTVLNQIFHFNRFEQGIVSGMIEMTQGLNYLSNLHIPLPLKSSLSAMILSFGGFSVHMQVISILSNTGISYKPYFIARVLHAIISGLIVYFLFDFWLFTIC